MTAPTAPMGATPAWHAVMDRAGQRCECAGSCGNRHSKSGLRCDVENGFYVKGNRGPVHLAAAPADLTLTAEQAAALPADQLKAWCPNCWAGAGRRARASVRAFERHTDTADTLF